MVKISICVGSACHLKGTHGILNAFNGLLDKHKVEAHVELAGNFCRSCCTEGVVIKIDEEIICNVSRDKVADIFDSYVLRGMQ